MISSLFMKVWLTLFIIIFFILLNSGISFTFLKSENIYPASLIELQLATDSTPRRKFKIPTLRFIMRNPPIDKEDRLKVISDRIQRNQSYPIQARELGIEGTTEVSFQIMPNGNLKELKIRETSGNTLLDNWSLKTIRRSAPFPYVQEVLILSIKYELKNSN